MLHSTIAAGIRRLLPGLSHWHRSSRLRLIPRGQPKGAFHRSGFASRPFAAAHLRGCRRGLFGCPSSGSALVFHHLGILSGFFPVSPQPRVFPAGCFGLGRPGFAGRFPSRAVAFDSFLGSSRASEPHGRGVVGLSGRQHLMRGNSSFCVGLSSMFVSDACTCVCLFCV